MGTTDSKAQDEKPGKRRHSWIRSLGLIGGLIAILAIPAGGYGLYVVDQLRDVEKQNLRTLAKAAGTVEAIVENLRTNVESLAGDPSFACDFQRRQTRLRLVTPKNCSLVGKLDTAEDTVRIDIESGKDGLQFTVKGDGESPTMTWAIRLDQVLAEIPFGNSMDVLLIADKKGRVVKQHPDPTASPDITNAPANSSDFTGLGSSQRGIRIGDLQQVKSKPEGRNIVSECVTGTLTANVVIVGQGYRMLCQPLVLSHADPEKDGQQEESWVLSGLVEQDRALRDALEVAPFLTVFLFSLFFFGLFLWPVLKILTMSPRERFRFADVYLLLLGSWGALMLATILVVTLDTYGAFKDAAAQSLEKLAQDVEDNLTAELVDIHRQLLAYDRDLDASLVAWLDGPGNYDDLPKPGDPQPHRLPQEFGDRLSLLNMDLPLDEATGKPVYPFFSSLYWIEPCSGQQIAKGAVRQKNTPKVNVSQRAYFQKVQEGKLWQLPGSSVPSDQYYLQTDRSLTTGEFFAALSTISQITQSAETTADTEENAARRSTLERYWGKIPAKIDYKTLRERHGRCGSAPTAVAVMSGQLVSITKPILAPGVGFAILDRDGNVVFHSDERRAKFENLFGEVSEGDRLRAILRSGATSWLDTKYRAHPHQVFARPMEQLPWSVVTFLDDEILRTSFLESLMHSVMLMLNHLLLYFLITLAYLAFWGRSSPVWMWPYLLERAADYRWIGWMLLVVLLSTGLVLHTVNGTNLLLFSLLIPLLPIAVVSIGPMIVRRNPSGRFVRNILALVASVTAIMCLAFSYYQFDQQAQSTAGYVLIAVLIAVWLPGTLSALLWPDRASNGSTSDITAVEHRKSLTAYMTAAVLIWVIIAVLPAYGYSKLAVNDQIGVLVKHENQSAMRQITAREDAIREYYLEVDMKDDYIGERMQLDQRDVYWFQMYGRGENSPDEEGFQPATKPLQSAFPWRKIAEYMPIYNNTSRDMRYLQQTLVAGDRRWLTDGNGLVEFRDGDPGRGSELYLQSRPAMVFPSIGIPTVAAAILTLLVISFWSRYGARQIFFGDIPAQTRGEPHAFSPRRGLYKQVTLEWVSRELAPVRHLEELKDVDDRELVRRFAARKEALDYINPLIKPHYETRFEECSDDEKLVLVQLAQEGAANPKQAQAVRSLLDRGLLFKDPALRIMNQSFALFASSAFDPTETKERESVGDGVNWAQTQKLLFGAIVLLLVFLITTQPAAVESLTKFFTGTAASVAAIVTLANKFSSFRWGGDN